MIWHEDDHPRDELGQFTEKGSEGRKTEKKEFRQNASYDEIIKADRQPPRYRKTKALTSAVFNMISPNRKTLERYGECDITVFVSGYQYFIALFGKEQVYDYLVLARGRI